MLLFVLAVRPGGDARADELRQPRARRLRHGRRLRHRAADGPLPACRSCSRLPLAFLVPAVVGAIAGAHALPADVQAVATSTTCSSRSASSSWRSRRSTTSWARSSSIIKLPSWLQRAASRSPGSRHRQVPALHHRRLRLLLTGILQLGAGAHALRQPAARRRRRPARGARAGHQRQHRVQRDLRGRLGAGGLGRCARRRGARPRPELSR